MPAAEDAYPIHSVSARHNWWAWYARKRDTQGEGSSNRTLQMNGLRLARSIWMIQPRPTCLSRYSWSHQQAAASRKNRENSNRGTVNWHASHPPHKSLASSILPSARAVSKTNGSDTSRDVGRAQYLHSHLAAADLKGMGVTAGAVGTDQQPDKVYMTKSQMRP